MANIKSTKRAIGAGVLALFLCFAMILGTTFAWFTDSSTSSNNIITAGNLDVELYWTTTPEVDGSWVKVDEDTNVFKGVDLWEPGKTEVVYLKVANAGTLALRYNMNVNIVSETGSYNVAGDYFKLSDHIMYGITEYTGKYNTADKAVAAVNNGEVTATKLNAAYISETKTLEKGKFTTVAMVVYMPETVNNEANCKNGAIAPKIKLGINLFATQATVESDSFSNNYDAESVVSNIADIGARIDANEDIALVGVNTPTEVLNLPEKYTGKVTLVNSILGSVNAAGDLNLAVYGSVVIKATEEGQSAITGKNINISGDGNLTAVGKGKAAFGVGGMKTESITIEDITVQYVEGGCAGKIGTDTTYYKDAPEGGSAIGSGYDGAVITLKNVVVKKAIGGSKAAGIGTRFWKGVTVNIENSVIEYVEGGVTAAGIGGSRVSKGTTEKGVTINITSSTISAVGGVYGAGIGSGYDAYCGSKQPLCTINIADSNIIAQGGQYAAGVGTGYHNAALAGEIKNSVVNAVSGDKFYKDECTQAQDIGFGVVDLTREGQQTGSKIIYNGKSITLKGELTVESAPIIGNSEVGKGEKYEGDIFDDEIKDALIVQNKDLTGGANITVERTYDSVVLENVIADVNGNLITSKTENTIVLWDCDIKLDDGEKIVKIDGDIYTVQVALHNVKVNGEILTSSTVEQYLEGVGTYTFY